MKIAARDVDRTRTLLAELRDDATACVDEVRRIVADLRPAALDQGGSPRRCVVKQTC